MNHDHVLNTQQCCDLLKDHRAECSNSSKVESFSLTNVSFITLLISSCSSEGPACLPACLSVILRHMLNSVLIILRCFLVERELKQWVSTSTLLKIQVCLLGHYLKRATHQAIVMVIVTDNVEVKCCQSKNIHHIICSHPTETETVNLRQDWSGSIKTGLMLSSGEFIAQFCSVS